MQLTRRDLLWTPMAAPMLSLMDTDRAVKELEWALANDARRLSATLSRPAAATTSLDSLPLTWSQGSAAGWHRRTGARVAVQGRGAAYLGVQHRTLHRRPVLR